MKPVNIQPSTYPQRNRYFFGKLLTVDDLQTEQNYFLDKHRRHNRLLHGFGVVSGLEVSTGKSPDAESVIKVGPGLALDCFGNEIILCETFEWRDSAETETKYVCIQYLELETDPVPGIEVGDKPPEFSRIEEQSLLTLATSNPAHHHRRRKTRWPACGLAHPIPLARLKRAAGFWRVERRYHRPTVG
jgi:hypothetical protein